MMYMAFSPPATIFLMSIILGMSFGALWDIFRILRLSIPSGKIFIFMQDVVYSLIICLATLIFFYFFTFGGFRFFVLIGEFFGFIIYYFTIGHIIFNVFKIIIHFLHKLIWILTWPLRKFLTKMLYFFKKLLYNFNQKIKKHLHIKKKNLHLDNISLYNVIKSKISK